MLAIFTPDNILAFILISGFAVLFHTRWDRQSVAIGPTILTTLGIFFCFLGIAIGLLNFDANDVKGSLPALLQGIRTAFWASVWGIGMALTIKARRAFGAPPALKEGQSSGATINDLVDQITKLNKSIIISFLQFYSFYATSFERL